MTTQAVIEKAARLVVKNAVAPMPMSRVARVRGENGSYIVTLAGTPWAYEAHCTCPADGVCSHVLAVAQVAGWPSPEAQR